MRWTVAGAIAAIVLGGACVFAPMTHANSINFSDPVVTPSGTDFLWRYLVTIDNLEFVDTVGHNPSFATLYDINGLVPFSQGYVPNIATLSGAATIQDTGITPATQNPADNPLIPNITVTFTGTAPPSTLLGVLSFHDTISGSNEVPGEFSAQATNAADGTVEANTSSTLVPSPEPGTLVLMGTVLLGGLMQIVRRRRHH